MKLSDGQARELKPQVRKAAAWLTRYQPRLRHDAEQEIWAGIVRKADGDEDFLAQKPAYIVQAGQWAAQTWMERVVKGDEREPVSLDAPQGDGECDLGDLTASSRRECGDPMDYVLPLIVVERICAKLAGDLPALAWTLGVLMGFRQNEVADLIGVSQSAVSQAKARAGAAIQSEQE